MQSMNEENKSINQNNNLAVQKSSQDSVLDSKQAKELQEDRYDFSLMQRKSESSHQRPQNTQSPFDLKFLAETDS